MLKPIRIFRQSQNPFSMAIAFKPPTPTFQLKDNTAAHSFLRFPSQRLAVPVRRFTPMAALSTAPTVGLSETFTRLKNQGKVRKPFQFYLISTSFTFCFVYYVPISFSIFSWVVSTLFIICIIEELVASQCGLRQARKSRL